MNLPLGIDTSEVKCKGDWCSTVPLSEGHMPFKRVCAVAPMGPWPIRLPPTLAQHRLAASMAEQSGSSRCKLHKRAARDLFPRHV